MPPTIDSANDSSAGPPRLLLDLADGVLADDEVDALVQIVEAESDAYSQPVPAALMARAAGLAWHAGGHPAPNDGSVAAAREALATAAASRSGGLLVVLLSGGASATMAAPADGITLADKIATAEALMQAGVAIDGLNCVRKHLSAIKGGRLAAAAGESLTLAISDVHGPVPDDPSVIGSGPTVADPTTFADALRAVRNFHQATVRGRQDDRQLARLRRHQRMPGVFFLRR